MWNQLGAAFINYSSLRHLSTLHQVLRQCSIHRLFSDLKKLFQLQFSSVAVNVMGDQCEGRVGTD
jgi:hypothetical protein